jgi:hypothetical protein
VGFEPDANFPKISSQARLENVLRRHSFETFFRTLPRFSRLATVVCYVCQQHGDGIQATCVFATWAGKRFETLWREGKMPHNVRHASSLRTAFPHNNPLTFFQACLPQVGVLNVLRVSDNNNVCLQ